MKILITGFEPFAGSDVNPSARAADSLISVGASGHVLVGATLPCVDGECERTLLDAVTRERPDVVLALGEHGRETGLAFERVALNHADYRIPDNAGNRVVRVLAPGAPLAYETSLPVRAMADRALDAGVPARVSRDAGAFLCNQAYFALLHTAKTGAIECASCFIHVPRLPEQVAREGQGRPSMSTDVVVRGLIAAIGTLSPDNGA